MICISPTHRRRRQCQRLARSRHRVRRVSKPQEFGTAGTLPQCGRRTGGWRRPGDRHVLRERCGRRRDDEQAGKDEDGSTAADAVPPEGITGVVSGHGSALRSVVIAALLRARPVQAQVAAVFIRLEQAGADRLREGGIVEDVLFNDERSSTLRMLSFGEASVPVGSAVGE